ncbi:MAG: DUF1318 domain-containing protein [Candidatus Hydrogenedentes bacterium]|nr:DUF1318 domain-containing protein [Candidatus Hydrogenedentota bacterium]
MKLKLTLLLCVLLVSIGCARMGSSFIKMRPDYTQVPEVELRAAAAALEKAAIQGEQEPNLDGFAGVVLDTPEIAQAIRTRALRASLFADLVESGHVYEQKNGTIKIINSREYKRVASSKERDRNAVLVMSENQNRWTLYEGVVEASQWSPGALAAVQHCFYEARVALMKAGGKYEDEQGNIVVK